MHLFKEEVEGKWMESAGAGHASIILVIKKRRELRQFMKEVWAGGGMWWAYICLNADRKETTETEVDIGMDGCRAQGEVLFLDRDTL